MSSPNIRDIMATSKNNGDRVVSPRPLDQRGLQLIEDTIWGETHDPRT